MQVCQSFRCLFKTVPRPTDHHRDHGQRPPPSLLKSQPNLEQSIRIGEQARRKENDKKLTLGDKIGGVNTATHRAISAQLHSELRAQHACVLVRILPRAAYERSARCVDRVLNLQSLSCHRGWRPIEV
eukprot:3323677-Prymnesium_polylepis.1